MATALIAAADIAIAPTGRAAGAPGGDGLDRAFARFLRLPERENSLVRVGNGGAAGRSACWNVSCYQLPVSTGL